MIDFLAKGGVLVIPILLCSVFTVAIFLERIITFARMRTRGAGLAKKVAGLLTTGQPAQARKTAEESGSPMGRVLAQAIDVKDSDRETLETVIVNAIEEEVRTLSSYVQALATIGNIAPLLGLLGTVIGMIKAFMVIQQMGGKVNAAVLAGGIWEAMLTTALGLAVALPAMLAHSYLVARIERYEARLQNGAVTFMKALNRS
ncbi:MAG: MotA/TolQ/ExbB proton channel family protein [Thermodesulfobacteriota bacterium]|nr:MotA/TolQ/ExbB proton channel family protein [Thermodesulfobacteriota bacterium]